MYHPDAGDPLRENRMPGALQGTSRWALLIVTAAVASTAAFAQPNHAKGHGKGKQKHEKADKPGKQ